MCYLMNGILQIKGVIKFMYTNKNECMTYLHHSDKTNLVIRENCIVILTYHKKQERSKQSNFISKRIWKRSKEPKVSKRKNIRKIKAEINSSKKLKERRPSL